ncbi:MAG: RNA methyltransferase [Peptococcaceae bacterium]|nr:RNA methyltransferase [Peptococcaceae bacterium]
MMVIEMEQMLTSIQNVMVRQLAGLKEKKGRDATGMFLVEGVRLVEEALQARVDIRQVVYSPKIYDTPRGRELMEAITKSKLISQLVSAKVLSHLTDTESPQGIAAAVRIPTVGLPEIKIDNKLLLVVDGVQDPGNLGTIVRTALAAGVGGIICTQGTVDLYNPKALRSTMGAVFKVPVVQNLSDIALDSWLGANGVPIVLADPNGEVAYYEADLTPPLAIVVGSEAHGPGEILRSRAGLRIRIPLSGGVESLNVAVAAALVLFESARQRSMRP